MTTHSVGTEANDCCVSEPERTAERTVLIGVLWSTGIRLEYRRASAVDLVA